MLMLILIWVICVLWLCFTRINRNKNEPPLAAGSLFLIGHALDYLGDSVHLWNRIQLFNKEAQQKGGVIKTTIGPQSFYIVTDPQDYVTILNSCLKKLKINDFARRWLGDGLLTSFPSTWRPHRRLLNPSFSQHMVDGFLGVFNVQARRLIENLEVEVGKGPFDHYVYSHHNALEAICMTSLGADFMDNKHKSNEYLHSVDKLLNIFISRFQRFWLHSDFIYFFSGLKREEDKCINISNKTSSAILKQRKENYKNQSKNTDENSKGPKYKPFIDLILELSQKTNMFSDNNIREHVDTIIAAGSDTVGGSITFCMLLIGSHPEVQDTIYKELVRVMGEEDKDVTKEYCSQLVYLEAVIKETLRIYPPVPIVGRDLVEDIKIRNFTLSKGGSVYNSIYAINHDTSWGADVEEFKPERWLDPSSIPEWANNITFGFGRRFCIGRTYAMKFMKVTMAHICRNYTIHGDYKKMNLKMDVLLKPVSGHHVTIEKREKYHITTKHVISRQPG